MNKTTCNVADKLIREAIREAYEHGKKEGIIIAMNYLSSFIPEIESRILRKVNKIHESEVDD